VVSDERGLSSESVLPPTAACGGAVLVVDADADDGASVVDDRAARDDKRGPDGRLRPLGPRLVVGMPPMVA
jgi:hypothetical protein